MIESRPDFSPKYEFCRDADWWKSGESYEDTEGQLGDSPLLSQLEQEFNERADRWEKETGIHSSPTKRFLHEDYQTIMTMGEPVIPLILRRLQTKPNDWFWALKHFARKDVALGKDNFQDAVRAWLNWGIENGYLSPE